MRWKLRVAAVLLLLAGAPAMAEHFEIAVTIATKEGKTTSQSTDTFPPPMGSLPRAVGTAAKGKDFVFQFFVNSNFPHRPIKGVTIRYYITPEEKVGQTTVPKRGAETVVEGTITMDFKPETGRVGLRQTLHIDTPGVYLVRVESENSDSDHEHFGAMDLKVE